MYGSFCFLEILNGLLLISSNFRNNYNGDKLLNYAFFVLGYSSLYKERV